MAVRVIRLGVYSLKMVELVRRALRCFSGPIIMSHEPRIEEDNEVCWRVFDSGAFSEEECKRELIQTLKSYSASFLCKSEKMKQWAASLASVMEGAPLEEAPEEVRGHKLNPLEAESVHVLLDEIRRLDKVEYSYAVMGIERPYQAKGELKVLRDKLQALRGSYY